MSIDFPSDPQGRELLLLIERAKYARWLEQETAALVAEAFDRVATRLLSPEFRSLTAAQRQRTLALYRELDRIIKTHYTEIAASHVEAMAPYAQLEADVARAQVATVFAAGSAELTVSLDYALPTSYLAAIARLPIQGLNIGEWFQAQAETMSRESRRIIQQGLIDGLAPAEISRRLVADARTKGPVLARRATTEARAITRTIVNAVQNDAAMRSYGALPASVSDSYRWLSVRDNRTTIICTNLDGRVFRYDDPQRRIPPAHINCRSSTMPIVRGTDVTLTEQRTGPLSFRSMGDWLRAQPNGVQNDILGVTRAGLFRDGKMTLADAVDGDARVLTLKELRERLSLDALVTP